MFTIAQNEVLAKLPQMELKASLHAFMEPLVARLPDRRLPVVAELMVQGIISHESPVVTQIARGVARDEQSIWGTSKRFYRFLANPRFSYRDLRKGLYHVAQQTVAAEAPARLVVAIDPVNFEKPYTHALEGVSTVHKSTPPALDGQGRLARGYPAITATIVNTRQRAVAYAHWFSYRTADFLSQNREVHRACWVTKALFPEQKLRFVADAGLDDQKVFAQMQPLNAEFAIRAKFDRSIDVYNDRLQRWEAGTLFDLAETVHLQFTDPVQFTHARQARTIQMGFGWFQCRLADDPSRVLWALVAHNPARDRDLILLTNVPLRSRRIVREVYRDWRLRSQIEHGYRFDQEQGLDVEDLRVTTLERMRRLYLLVLLAAQFVGHIHCTWSAEATQWFRLLGGSLGLPQDRHGLYVLLRGMAAVWGTLATLAFVTAHPFPEQCVTCG